MSRNLERLQDAYAAFARGDTALAFADLDPECVFRAGSDLLPTGGEYHGKREIVGRWLPTLAAHMPDLRLLIDEIVESGDTICVTGTSRATLAGSSIEVKSPFCHVWHFRAGKIAGARFFTDTAVLMDAIQQRDGVMVHA